MSATTPGAEPEGEGGTVLALVPAKDEAERVAASVLALRALPAVAVVLVVSEGSSDASKPIDGRSLLRPGS